MGDLYGELGVIGATVAGGYAELCLVPATARPSDPRRVSWHHAVAFPSAWLTAHHALFESGHLGSGRR